MVMRNKVIQSNLCIDIDVSGIIFYINNSSNQILEPLTIVMNIWRTFLMKFLRFVNNCYFPRSIIYLKISPKIPKFE